FWMLPFLRMAWHGGAGNNLRYFLPLLPWLALLCAYGLRELSRLGARPFSVALWALVGLGALVVGVLIWDQQGIALAASLQQRLPQWLMLALAFMGAATALVGRTRAAALASVTAGLTVTALILAGVLGNLFDLSQSQRVRTYYQAREAHFAPLPAPSLVLSANPPAFLFQLRRENAFQARLPRDADRLTDADLALVETALGAGYRVFVADASRAARIAATLGAHESVVAIPASLFADPLVEVRPAPEPARP
ncbi:MAG: hypothetical protein AAGI34_12785, partial [Pseudomonadota bacterium]